MRIVIRVLVTLLTTAVAVACGSEFSSNATQDSTQRDSAVQEPIDASNGGAAGSGGAGEHAGSSDQGGTNSAGVDTPGPDGATTFVDATVGGVGGARVDGGSSGNTGGNTGKDAAVASGIFCGGSICDPVTQVCCGEIGALEPGATQPLRCVAKGMCSGMSPMNIPCDDHSDCAKSQPTLPICCAGTSYGSPNGHFALFECTIQTGCTTNANVRHEYMCSGPDDHDSCPMGKVCRAGTLREGYFTCQ
jgi:hypothetical protein